MAAAAGAALGRLRLLLLAYVAAIALTRVTFGAHFPIDAVVGGLVGYQLGRFSVAITRAFGLLPARSLEPLAAPADAVPLAVAPHSRGA